MYGSIRCTDFHVSGRDRNNVSHWYVNLHLISLIISGSPYRYDECILQH